MSFYEKYILPRILNCACASEPITYQRKKVVPLAEGKILEVGIGSGLNLPFYDKSKIEEIWGIDPSEELNAMAKKVAIEEFMNVNFITSSAEDIPFPNDYFDTVLLTYTMCTIPKSRASRLHGRFLVLNLQLVCFMLFHYGYWVFAKFRRLDLVIS